MNELHDDASCYFFKQTYLNELKLLKNDIDDIRDKCNKNKRSDVRYKVISENLLKVFNDVDKLTNDLCGDTHHIDNCEWFDATKIKEKLKSIQDWAIQYHKLKSSN